MRKSCGDNMFRILCGEKITCDKSVENMSSMRQGVLEMVKKVCLYSEQILFPMCNS